jgi:hypothetical protein
MLCLLLAGIIKNHKKKKEKRNGRGAFFFPGQEARHTFLAVPCWFFY